MFIYLDGQIVSREEARISPFDHGFMYGLGAFETFRTYDGFPFLIDEHISRLHEALEELNISIKISTADVTEMVTMLLNKNKLKDAYFRLNVSAGAGDIGLQTDPYEEPTVILFTKPLALSSKPSEKELVKLKTVRNTPEGEKRIKSHHYLNSILGKRELTNPLTQEGFFLTKEGYISEGTVSNLFWVNEGELFTPCVSTGILEGITRKWMLHTSELLNIPVKTGNYTINELKRSEEVFLTNSIQELVPVRRFEDKEYAGNEGRTLQKFQNLYRLHTKEKRTQI
ncbi:aminodeoxychorismate lyase [Bacillus sp. NEB1478]|uniref:aminodeoxychorismate lyase n=1 Tax=Bacillus sp. NEB1478 TaxID=3073816 RepID=UPI00287321A3|nr:aminodeoxychorismate lyase [Bacillus sp. NEB1478]WNB92009.1 aminodeoxychorismate lyase [Bacillus sp. NEB1478]